MKILLIRHAETVHNVGHVWAGTTDSPLTNHGILQIQRLAQHFRAEEIRFSHVFASDLQRAVRTAEGICERPLVDNAVDPGTRVTVTTTPLLREQDFGSREGAVFGKPAPLTTGESTTRPEETWASMRARTSTFLSRYFLPALHAAAEDDDNQAIAVVAHGVILRVLWACLVEALSPIDVDYGSTPGAAVVGPHWSNTGYMEMSILLRRGAAVAAAAAGKRVSKGSMAILCIDNTTHLLSLRRIGGGIGSAAHDVRQKTMKSYFKPVRREK